MAGCGIPAAQAARFFGRDTPTMIAFMQGSDTWGDRMRGRLRDRERSEVSTSATGSSDPLVVRLSMFDRGKGIKVHEEQSVSCGTKPCFRAAQLCRHLG